MVSDCPRAAYPARRTTASYDVDAPHRADVASRGVNLRVTYDRAADAAWLYLRAIGPGEARSKPLTGTLIADFDEGGHLIGLEVLHASHVLPAEVLAGAEDITGGRGGSSG